ncbi:MAG: TasA family protein [Actinomycetota bacterium]|nr:TasA family protein [Actinomycetota bacterium]
MQNVAIIKTGPRMLRRMVKARVRKKILSSLLTIGLVAILIGGATFTYFSDPEQSTGNIAQAGTLDLRMGPPGYEVDDPGAIITATNLAPCKEAGPYEIGFKNVGTLPGILSITISYDDADGTGTAEFRPGLVTANAFAEKLYVTQALYDRNQDGDYEDTNEDVLADWKAYADANNDGKLSVHEMALKTWTFTEPLGPGASTKVQIKLHLDAYADNDYQAEGINVTITGILNQLNQ